jgi:hypothetical protein
LRKYRLLVEQFGGDRLRIPEWSTLDALRRDWAIAKGLAEGADPADLAARHKLTKRRIWQIKRELLLRGWLSFANGRAGREVTLITS